MNQYFMKMFKNLFEKVSVSCSTSLFLVLLTGGRTSAQEIIFQSGFEPGSKVVNQAAVTCDIVGVDQSLPVRNDWVSSLENHSDIGYFEIEYYGGDISQRFAEIVPESGNPSNHILHYWIKSPNNIYSSAGETSQRNGRIQASIRGDDGQSGPREIYYSVRILLPDEMNLLRTYPGVIKFFTIAEFWNQPPYTPYTNMMTFGLRKLAETESDLTFSFDVSEKINPLGAEPPEQPRKRIWSADISSSVKVPIGKWFTLECYLKEGNDTNGRVYMAITEEGGKKQILFDVNNWTYHSKEPSPNGFGYLSLMKLYTSTELVNYARNRGKVLEMYWDDIKIWKDKKPDKD